MLKRLLPKSVFHTTISGNVTAPLPVDDNIHEEELWPEFERELIPETSPEAEAAELV